MVDGVQFAGEKLVQLGVVTADRQRGHAHILSIGPVRGIPFTR